MIKEYRHLKDFSNKDFIKEMSEINDGMFEILVAMDSGFYTNKQKRINDLILYIESLVNGQRQSLGRTKAGSWGLVPDDDGMDADARVEFIFKPTYIATSTLSRFFLEFPLYASRINNFEKALHDGMIFCTYRNLQGHGYEGDEGAIEALKILAFGKVPYFLMKHSDFCPKLKLIINQVANDMAKRLENGTAIGSWGEDYSEGFRSALETLFLLNNKDFMVSFKRLKNDGNSIGKGELPW